MRGRLAGSPLVAGHVEVGAQRPPHVARIDHRPRWPGRRCARRGRSARGRRAARRRAPGRTGRRPARGIPSAARPPTYRRPRERVMAHPYRIGDVGDALARPPGRVPVAGRRQHVVDGRGQRLRPSAAGPAAHCLGAQRDWRSPTGLPHPAPPPSARRPAAPWPPCRARRRRSPRRRATAVRPDGRVRRRPTAAPSTSGRRPAGTPPPAPRSAASPRASAIERQLGQALRARHRRRRCDHDHRARRRRERRAPPTSARSAGARRRRPRRASPGAAPPARAGWRSVAAPGRDPRRADRSRRAPPNVAAAPPAHDRAVSARITVSRNRPRTPTPGASPLPSGGRPFDGRYSGCGFSSTHGTPSSLRGHPAAGGDDVGDHQIGCQVLRAPAR